MTSLSTLLSYQAISTANIALVGQIGCAEWMITQKDTKGSRLFSYLPFFHMQVKKNQFIMKLDQFFFVRAGNCKTGLVLIVHNENCN